MRVGSPIQGASEQLTTQNSQLIKTSLDSLGKIPNKFGGSLRKASRTGNL